MGHHHHRPAFFDRTICHRQVVAPAVKYSIPRRPPSGSPIDRTATSGIPTVVGHLPVVRVAADDCLRPGASARASPVVDARAREVFPDLIRVVVLENHDALATSVSLIELIAEPADLLGRNARRPRLLRVEPNEPKSVQARRAVWLANVTAEPDRAPGRS